MSEVDQFAARTPATGLGVRDLPRIARGEGSYLYDTAGKRYLDGSGGPAVYAIGHAHPVVNAAINRQLEDIAHGYRYFFTSDALENLTERIVVNCENHFRHMVFVCSGSEAVESALKIALQYHDARGEPSRRRFIARERSYHGNTIGSLSVSGFEQRRAPFEGGLLEVDFVSPANAYRPPPDARGGDLGIWLRDELEDKILEIGPERVAAFIFEPVVGAAGGVVPPPAGYAAAMRDVCDRYGVLMIADEVMCGAGRCGTWRALEFDGVVPDIMTLAKSLAAGYLPLGATLYSSRVNAGILERYAEVQTGHTFTGHTACCAAGDAVQKIVADEGLVERVSRIGETFKARLRSELGAIDVVGDVRGRGFLVGVEFVADRDRKTPFPRERGFGLDIARRAFDSGLICYPCSGHVDGAGDTIILAPPFNSSQGELDAIVDMLKGAVLSTRG